MRPDSVERPVEIARWGTLKDRQPVHALVANVDLVVVRFDDQVSVLFGRCLHRGALMADGTVRGRLLDLADRNGRRLR